MRSQRPFARACAAVFYAWLSFAGPASAQWQTPTGTVPVGQGAGVTGFSSAGPFPYGTALGNVNPTTGAPTVVAARIKLTGNTTFYVRPAGDNTNCTGLTNADYGSGSFPQACAWQTPQGAADTLKNSFDLAGHVVTVQLADGTYTSSSVNGTLVINGPFAGAQTPSANNILASCPVIFTGNAATPTNVIINNSGASPGTILASTSTFFCLQNFAVTGASATGLIRAGGGAVVRVDNIVAGANAASAFTSTHGAVIETLGASPTLSFNGNSTSALFEGSFGGAVYINGATIKLLSNVTAAQFVTAYDGGSAYVAGITYTPGAFTFTGKRFAALNGGNISTNGGGLTYLPGTSIGTVDSGGSYDGITLYTSPLSINLNTVTPSIASPAGTGFHLAGANGGPNPQYLASGFASPSAYGCRRADTTAASPSAVTINEQLCSMTIYGYDGSSYIPVGGVASAAAQNWSVGNNGTLTSLYCTANGSATLTECLRVDQNGAMMVPATVTGGNKGTQTANFGGLVFSAGNALAASATSPITLNASTGVVACATCLTGNQTITLSGDATGSGATAITATVGKVNGVTYPSGPSANTVPVVTSAAGGGTVTYEAVPNAALANSSVTVAGHSVSLGGSTTVACGDLSNGGGACSQAYAASTWTPTLLGSTLAGSPTYSAQVGSYENVGRQWTARFTLGVTALGGPTGNMLIGGLPFTQANTANDFGQCFVLFMQGVTMDASYTVMVGFIQPNTNQIQLWENGSGVTTQQMAVARFAAATQIYGICFGHT